MAAETPFDGDDKNPFDDKPGEDAAKPVRRRYWGMQPDGDFGVEIVFDEDDIEDCKEVAFVLYGVIHGHYGAAVANKIFSERVMTARQIKKEKNDRLLRVALRRLIDSRSVEQVAADLAEENKAQWRIGGTSFYGPAGATTPSTMATQIRRLWKTNKNNPDIRQWLSKFAGWEDAVRKIDRPKEPRASIKPPDISK
jgi:hypothetical protein